MKKDILSPFRHESKKYCENNNLSFEKLLTLPKCGNDQILFVQYYEKATGEGLNCVTPAEIVVMAEKNGIGEVRITPGENIKQRLSF